VPDGQATFDVSNTTHISISADASVGSIVFNPSASAFTIKTDPAVRQTSVGFTVTGLGIINHSGITQNIGSGIDAEGNGSSISFTGNATVSSGVRFTTEGNPTGDFAWGSAVVFYDNSSAGEGTYHNKGASVPVSAGGRTDFYGRSTAANGTFINDGGTADGAGGSTTTFQCESDASNAIIIANGGTASGAGGAIISFSKNALLDNATLICKGGVDGGQGGSIWFSDYTADNTNTARVKLFGNGIMYVEGAGGPGVDIGSLEGDGIVYLGEKFLSVGRNNLDTTFSGLLASYDGQNFGGVLQKVGEGTLTLSGANTYADHTTVLLGALVANNTTGSATGTGPVQVQAGILGGKGTIAGPVTIGVGIGTGAVLAPSAGLGQLAILTMQQTLTFKPDGTYSYRLNTNNARADQVIANGLTILSGAQFSFQPLGNRSLSIGTIFTAISNTSANPIAGAFVNLPDGSTFTAGRNNFQVSYSGGDGNDLTLTVVP
jgi:autotransporter-associated beta strand protein